MAGRGKPGPAPKAPNAGRPRKAQGSKRPDGYVNVTVGPPGDGHRATMHRKKAYGGVPPASSKSAKTGIVNHLGARSNNSRVEVTTRSVNNQARNRGHSGVRTKRR